MHDQVSEFIGHEVRKSPIEIEYRIIAKPRNSVTSTPNMIFERIHQVMGNLTWNYDIK